MIMDRDRSMTTLGNQMSFHILTRNFCTSLEGGTRIIKCALAAQQRRNGRVISVIAGVKAVTPCRVIIKIY